MGAKAKVLDKYVHPFKVRGQIKVVTGAPSQYSDADRWAWWDRIENADIAHPWTSHDRDTGRLISRQEQSFTQLWNSHCENREMGAEGGGLYEIDMLAGSELRIEQFHAYECYLKNLASVLTRQKVPGLLRISCWLIIEGGGTTIYPKVMQTK